VDAKAFEQHCAVLQWWCELLEWALKDGDCVWPAVAPRQRVAALLLWNPVEVVRAACEDSAWYADVCGAPQIPVRSATDILRFMADKKRPEWSVDTERLAATLHVCSSLDRAYALDGGEATVRCRADEHLRLCGSRPWSLCGGAWWLLQAYSPSARLASRSRAVVEEIVDSGCLALARCVRARCVSYR
jgi:hypothetical protein